MAPRNHGHDRTHRSHGSWVPWLRFLGTLAWPWPQAPWPWSPGTVVLTSRNPQEPWLRCAHQPWFLGAMAMDPRNHGHDTQEPWPWNPGGS